jgi:hypothetical protein
MPLPREAKVPVGEMIMWTLRRFLAVLVLGLALSSFSLAQDLPPSSLPSQSWVSASVSSEKLGTAAPGYSPFRYWLPGFARIHDNLHGPRIDCYPPNRHPEIVPTLAVLKFPCPSAEGSITVFTPPTPPSTSLPRR